MFKRRKIADDADKMRHAQRKAAKQVGIAPTKEAFERLADRAAGGANDAVPVGRRNEGRFVIIPAVSKPP